MKRSNTTAVKTYDITQDINIPLDGVLDDWPAKVQDRIYLALEELSKRVESPLAIVMSRCAEDVDKAIDEPGRYFIHCIASEVVAADEREVMPTLNVLSEPGSKLIN